MLIVKNSNEKWRSVITTGLGTPRKILSLGTANLENTYGTKGKQSCLKISEAEKIVEKIISQDESSIETSPSYGQAESIIGQLLSGEKFNRITTKITPERFGIVKDMIHSVEDSLKRLRQESIDAVMLHGGFPEILVYRDQIAEAIESILRLGYVKRFGFSAYSESEILSVNHLLPGIKQFQILENIADQRTKDSQALNMMAKTGIRFQVRSIFLQGKLMGNNELIEFPEILPVIAKIDTLARDYNTNRVSICLEYVRTISWATELVIGVESFSNFCEIQTILEKPILGIKDFGKPLVGNLADPRKW